MFHSAEEQVHRTIKTTCIGEVFAFLYIYPFDMEGLGRGSLEGFILGILNCVDSRAFSYYFDAWRVYILDCSCCSAMVDEEGYCLWMLQLFLCRAGSAFFSSWSFCWFRIILLMWTGCNGHDMTMLVIVECIVLGLLLRGCFFADLDGWKWL